MDDRPAPIPTPDDRRIFVAALDRPEASRAAFVAEACAGDCALRERVLQLLHALHEAGSYLSLPEGPLDADDPLIGQQLGTYRIAGLLGEGGFGRVYRAEQEAPMRRAVAVKILKAGFESGPVVARFEAERQALAVMDHPHIARVFDGGITRDGRPYFVMELVNGEPITSYCDRYRLDATARLRLAITVCEAVQHAHQKGVIHRDIKPSNILVARDGDYDIAKVIDFGVAKAIEGDLAERAVVTEFRQLIGTPAYMSPEQADRDRRRIDTRTDVYSLGVVLYELLTGALPIEHESLLAAGLDEMRRVLRETDPPRPSARLAGVGADAESIALARRTDLRRLQRFVRGDLDWIVMKAIDRDPARRYGSSAALAADLERLLRHEPVEAGPPGARYRLAKFLRRHRVGMLAGSLAAASLLVGAGAAMYGLLEARAERDAAVLARDGERAAREVAEREGERARVQSDFISWGLGIGGDLSIDEAERPNITVRRMLDIAAATVDREYAGEPLRQAAAHSRLGSLYNRILRTAEATRELLRAIELLRGSQAPAATVLLYESLRDLDSVGVDQYSTDRALEPLRRERVEVALSILEGRLGYRAPEAFANARRAAERLFAPGSIDGETARGIERDMGLLLDEPLWKDDEDLAIYLDVVATAIRSAAGRHDSPVLLTLSLGLWPRFAELCPTLGADHIRAAIDELIVGSYCIVWGHSTDAIAYFEHGRAMVARHLPRDHVVLLTAELYEGWARIRTGEVERGLATMRSAVERMARSEAVPPGRLGRSIADLLAASAAARTTSGLERLETPLQPFGAQLEAVVQAKGAKEAEERAVALRDAIAPAVARDPRLGAMVLSATAGRLTWQLETYGSQVPEVARLLERLVDAAPLANDNTWSDDARADALWMLGDAALARGDLDEAEERFAQAQAIRTDLFGAESEWVQTCLRGRAKVLIARGSKEEGLRMLEQAYRDMRKVAAPTQRAVLTTTRDLGQALAGAGRQLEAGMLLSEQLRDSLDFATKEQHGLASVDGRYRLTLAFPIVLIGGLPQECYATAERCARAAAELDPGSAWSRAIAGAALVRQGRFAEGEVLLREAHAMLAAAKSPPVTTHSLFLARCADARGDKAEADRLRAVAEERAAAITPDLANMMSWAEFRDALLREFTAP